MFQIKYARLIIALVAVLTLGAAWRASFVGFNYDFEAFFPASDPETHFFLEFRKQFGPDNDFVLVGIQNREGVYNSEFLLKVRALSDSLKTIKWVERINAPTNVSTFIRDPLMGSALEIPYLHPEKPELLPSDSARISKAPELMGSLFSKDGKSVALVIDHTPYIGDTACQPLSAEIEAITASFGFDEYHIAGRCIGQSYYVDIIKGELAMFLIIAFFLILLVLFAIFRTFWGVTVPVLMVVVAVLWTVALMEVTGKEMDVLANIIPTIIVVVGLSVAIHFMTKFLDVLKQGKNHQESVKSALKQVGLANVFTTATTMTGFASLATSGIIPIDDFGLYAAAGVGFSLLLSLTFLPALLILVHPSASKVKSPQWFGPLTKIYDWLSLHPKYIFSFFLVLLVAGIAGTLQVRENTYLMEDLAQNSKLAKDFRFFAQEFNGTRPFELALEVKDTSLSVFDATVLESIQHVEHAVDSIYGIPMLFSPLSLVRGANRAWSGDDPEAYVLPESKARLSRIQRDLQRFKQDSRFRKLISEDQKEARIRGMLPDLGSSKAWELRQSFEQWLSEAKLPAKVHFSLTGTAELIDKNNRNLALNIAQGLAIAFLLIMGIIMYLFRSIKMVLISLIPNLLPLILLAGIMGWTGISLKISTAILFTIAFGIAVDDTIHFLTRLRFEQKAGYSTQDALRQAFLHTGKPILITTGILCAGFSILGVSSFMATKMIGLLTSVVLIFAVLADLVLLPALFKVLKIK